MSPQGYASATTLHASCVAVAGRGLLILGPSGSGKSSLALQLMAMGADLVADDQTIVTRRDAQLFARSPAALAGLIEARGLGILRAPPLIEAEIVLVVDLSQTESDRLPPLRKIALLEVPLDLVLGSQSNHFPASVLCYLRYGRKD